MKKTRIKVDRGKNMKRQTRTTTYPFDEMNPGDSFYYEGSRSGPIIAFGYRAIRGMFSTQKEITYDDDGNEIASGWRFFMLKDPTK